MSIQHKFGCKKKLDSSGMFSINPMGSFLIYLMSSITTFQHFARA